LRSGPLAIAALALCALAPIARGDAPATPAVNDQPSLAPGDRNPDWRVRPTPEQVAAIYPASTAAALSGGHASMRCTVTVEGTLRDCSILEESPAGFGFGPAMLSLAPQLSFSPAIRNGRPVEHQVDIPFDFARQRPFDTAPDWLHQPTRDDLMLVYPNDPRAYASGGSAVLACVVNVHGTLSRCQVASEDPPALGFGAAALALTPQFTFHPALLGGQPVESAIRLPIHFARTDMAPLRGLLFSDLEWQEAPSAQDVMAAWPARARQARVGGYVLLRCGYRRSGHVGDCRVVHEEPPGHGFGEAADRLSSHFRSAPPTVPRGHGIEEMFASVPVAFPVEFLDPAGPVVTEEAVEAYPDRQHWLDAWPAAARASRTSGRAALQCAVGPDRALIACQVEREEPSGQGFGQAALGLTSQVRAPRWTHGGVATTGAHIALVLEFDARYLTPATPTPAPH
jgi:TonB family protein